MEDYTWNTEEAHSNNEITMIDYIENHMPEEWVLVFFDGTYCEVNTPGNSLFALHAGGNGDFTSHRIRFEHLKKSKCIIRTT